MIELYLTNSVKVWKTNFFTTFFSLLEMTGSQIGSCIGSSLGLTLDQSLTISVKGKSCEKDGKKTTGKQLGAPCIFSSFGFIFYLLN